MAQALRQEIAGMYERLGTDDITVLAPEEGVSNSELELGGAVRKLCGWNLGGTYAERQLSAVMARTRI